MSQQFSGKEEFYPSRGGRVQMTSGLYAAIPAAGVADRYYWATDIFTLFRDTGAAWEVAGAQDSVREIPSLYDLESDAFGITATGRVCYIPFQVKRTRTVDGLIVIHGGTAAGNLYVALYDSTNYAPVNRLAVSVSTAVNGINRRQCVVYAATARITPGVYFGALEPDNGADKYMTHDSVAIAGPGNIAHGIPWYFENLGAYGVPPLVATPTAITSGITNVFLGALRVSVTP